MNSRLEYIDVLRVSVDLVCVAECSDIKGSSFTASHEICVDWV